MNIKQWIFRYLVSPQKKYEAYHQFGGGHGAKGVLKTLEESGKWPPDPIVEWTASHLPNQEEVIRFARLLLQGVGRARANYVFQVIIPNLWRGISFAEDLKKLVQETGVKPDAKTLRAALKQFLVKRPRARIGDAAERSEIENLFGIELGETFFQEVHDSLYSYYESQENPLIRHELYQSILVVACNHGIPPRKYSLQCLIKKLFEEGRLVYVEDLDSTGKWELEPAPELLKQFQRLEAGQPLEEVLPDALPLVLSEYDVPHYLQRLSGKRKPDER